MLEKMRQCAEVLMTPDTSFDASHDPHSRPEHEVDLSSLGPPLRHGKVLLITSLHARAAMRANGAAPLACALWLRCITTALRHCWQRMLALLENAAKAVLGIGQDSLLVWSSLCARPFKCSRPLGGCNISPQ